MLETQARSRDEIVDGFKILTALLRGRQIIVKWTIVAGLLTLLAVLLTPRKYTAVATFAVENPSALAAGALGGITALAAEAGLSVPQGELSPAYFGVVLQSREILERAVYQTYPIAGPAGTEHMDLIHFLDLDDLDSAHALERALRVLNRDWTSVNVDDKTAIVGLSVTTPEAELSAALAAYVLNQLDEFNVKTRQSSARAEREFVEQRVSEAEQRLQAAQHALESFLERNRTFQNSPRLQLQWSQLQQQQQLEQDLYLTLRREYEQARIAEVKDTPTITHIENPRIPAVPDRRHAIIKGIIGAFLGALVGVATALVRHRPLGTGSGTESYEVFVAELRAARQQASTLVRRAIPTFQRRR